MSNNLSENVERSRIPDGGGFFEKRADFGKTKNVCRECGADITEFDWSCPNCGQPDVQENKILRSKFPYPKKELE